MRTKPDFLRRLFEVFLEEEPKRIAALGQAVSGSDLDLVRHIAHALKGAAATMGMERLRDACRELGVRGQGRRGRGAHALFREDQAGDAGRVRGDARVLRTHLIISVPGNENAGPLVRSGVFFLIVFLNIQGLPAASPSCWATVQAVRGLSRKSLAARAWASGRAGRAGLERVQPVRFQLLQGTPKNLLHGPRLVLGEPLQPLEPVEAVGPEQVRAKGARLGIGRVLPRAVVHHDPPVSGIAHAPGFMIRTKVPERKQGSSSAPGPPPSHPRPVRHRGKDLRLPSSCSVMSPSMLRMSLSFCGSRAAVSLCARVCGASTQPKDPHGAHGCAAPAGPSRIRWCNRHAARRPGPRGSCRNAPRHHQLTRTRGCAAEAPALVRRSLGAVQTKGFRQHRAAQGVVSPQARLKPGIARKQDSRGQDHSGHDFVLPSHRPTSLFERPCRLVPDNARRGTPQPEHIA